MDNVTRLWLGRWTWVDGGEDVIYCKARTVSFAQIFGSFEEFSFSQTDFSSLMSRDTVSAMSDFHLGTGEVDVAIFLVSCLVSCPSRCDVGFCRSQLMRSLLACAEKPRFQ